jgi:hypothetical protein
MTESTWTIVFKSNRETPVRELTENKNSEKDFYRRIEEIKADHWLTFVKGILPNGQEIKS